MEAARNFLEIFFTEVILMRAQNNGMIKKAKERMIDRGEFMEIMKEALKWMKGGL